MKIGNTVRTTTATVRPVRRRAVLALPAAPPLLPAAMLPTAPAREPAMAPAHRAEGCEYNGWCDCHHPGWSAGEPCDCAAHAAQEARHDGR